MDEVGLVTLLYVDLAEDVLKVRHQVGRDHHLLEVVFLISLNGTLGLWEGDRASVGVMYHTERLVHIQLLLALKDVTWSIRTGGRTAGASEGGSPWL